MVMRLVLIIFKFSYSNEIKKSLEEKENNIYVLSVNYFAFLLKKNLLLSVNKK